MHRIIRRRCVNYKMIRESLCLCVYVHALQRASWKALWQRNQLYRKPDVDLYFDPERTNKEETKKLWGEPVRFWMTPDSWVLLRARKRENARKHAMKCPIGCPLSGAGEVQCPIGFLNMHGDMTTCPLGLREENIMLKFPTGCPSNGKMWSNAL